MRILIRARWLTENLGKIVIDAVEEEPFFAISISEVVEFPSLFSVSSRINVSDYYNAQETAINYPISQANSLRYAY